MSFGLLEVVKRYQGFCRSVVKRYQGFCRSVVMLRTVRERLLPQSAGL